MYVMYPSIWEENSRKTKASLDLQIIFEGGFYCPYNMWIQCMITVYEYNVWIQCMDTMYGYSVLQSKECYLVHVGHASVDL